MAEVKMITVITKYLGPFATWRAKLKALRALEYNSVHFTPLQPLGESMSAYSLVDQLGVCLSAFPEEETVLTAKEKKQKLQSLFDSLRPDLSFCGDVVLNHTANNTPWLATQLEASYNVHNSPHLQPALDLDLAIQALTSSILAGTYATSHGLTMMTTDADLKALERILVEELVPTLRLWEYYVVDVLTAIRDMEECLKRIPLERGGSPRAYPAQWDPASVQALYTRVAQPNTVYSRSGVTVQPELVLQQIFQGTDISEEDVLADYRSLLDTFNVSLYAEYDADIAAATSAIVNTVRYEFLEQGATLSDTRPLVYSYFAPVVNPSGVTTYCACNGWIYGQSSTADFSKPTSKAYLRRELIIWGDSVKLRYGESAADSPWLWKHMQTYCEETAQLFDAIRLDNCHSTPLHVARHMIDAARKVRPNLLVIAELFTGSDDEDHRFISALGINALIREAMQSPSPSQLSEKCYRFGGAPVGSVRTGGEGGLWNIAPPLLPSHPASIFFDCTHDNESANERRNVVDSLSNAALVAFTHTGTGSVFGYDQLYARRIDLVRDVALYGPAEEGIGRARTILNRLHSEMVTGGYSEQHTHQQGATIVLHRHTPSNHHGIYCISRTAFDKFGDIAPSIGSVTIPGLVEENVTIMSLQVEQEPIPSIPRTGTWTGLKSTLSVTEGTLGSLPVSRYLSLQLDEETRKNVLHFQNFPPGSVAIVRASLPPAASEAVELLRRVVKEGVPSRALLGLTLLDCNVLLYQCEVEERNWSEGERGTYTIPHYGALKYAGIAGVCGLLQSVCATNDMGHPLFDNLRAGDWLLDYLVHRLRHYDTTVRPSLERAVGPGFSEVVQWLEVSFGAMKQLPRYLIPTYFSSVLTQLFEAVVLFVTETAMSSFVRTGSSFVRRLALVSVQMVGIDPHSALISGELYENDAHLRQYLATMAAGLPHFSTGYMRCWGRDTFISLRGLMLTTGRFSEAKSLLLGFATTLRHGLIPNLIASGGGARYNARDATWWWLQALQDYVKMAPGGLDILSETIYRLYPSDDHYGAVSGLKGVPLHSVVQEVMQRHCEGIRFRERNAGVAIDRVMSDDGFQVEVALDPLTGLLLGVVGNQNNCGTWMDKMGESHSAGNFGVPATPRDGAPIEITGLLKSTLRWLCELGENATDHFPYSGVAHNSVELAYTSWNATLLSSFEEHYFVPCQPSQGESPHIFRRGIYKDTVGSATAWADYRLRPNQVVAMAVAPELFTQSNAQSALEVIEAQLVGKLGMATLDPEDLRYRPNYDNAIDSSDYDTSKGFNYHQGPEWLWLRGYYLRARLHFPPADCDASPEALRTFVLRQTQYCRESLSYSLWQGLPELTNLGGVECRDSCPTQAWSSATLLDAFYDLQLLELEHGHEAEKHQ
eukprot:TRINITY_DN2190_c0_g1_i1.p1 TRINITY_DN2190_c0_g1~~TRINITY_DN2190_c0_g1_i1.p1  ORF type:complete len:1571 (-),score=177.42 TRINITY_DN2190_c0_g1_i1:40-4221(-)